MPITKTPDGIVNATIGQLRESMTELSGVSWCIDWDGDPWNLWVALDCRGDDLDHASVSRQVCIENLSDDVVRIAAELVEASRARATMLTEIGINQVSPIW